MVWNTDFEIMKIMESKMSKLFVTVFLMFTLVGCSNTFTVNCDNGFTRTGFGIYIDKGIVYWKTSVYKIPDGVTCTRIKTKE